MVSVELEPRCAVPKEFATIVMDGIVDAFNFSHTLILILVTISELLRFAR